MIRSIFLGSLFFFSSLVHAQSFKDISAFNDLLVYRSPDNGETYVPARTTLIARFDHAIVRRHSTEDFSFIVRGESSGIHLGKVLISDDKETVIFKPSQTFNLGELVTVILSFEDEKNIGTVSYSFRITPLSDSEQHYWLHKLHDDERAEIERIQKKEAFLRPYQEIENLKNDPLAFPKFSIDTLVPDKVAPGNIFISQGGNNTDSSFLDIVDNFGQPLFQRVVPSFGCAGFRPWPNNTLSYFRIDTAMFGDNESGKGIVLDSNFAIIDSFECDRGFNTNYHEFQLLPNGHAIVIAVDQRDTDMTVVLNDPQASKHARVFGAVIQELDSAKNVVFRWSTWDHFQITDVTNMSLRAPVIDYTHLNSVALDNDGNLIASFRHMDEVTKINRTNGKIIWRWGGKNNYFEFKGDTMRFSQQHDVRRIANGHITMFDNGNFRKTMWGDGSYHDTVYSRAIEYELNEGGPLTATAVWQYSNFPFSLAGGNVERLPNENTFIGLGFRDSPNAIEVTPKGEKVFQLSVLRAGAIYRTFRFEFPKHTSIVSSSPALEDFGILTIYPNPAHTKTTITFSAAAAGDLQIDLLNILGQTVRSTQEMLSGAGIYTVDLDLQNLPSGTYYCKLSQNGNSNFRVIVVSK